MTLVDEIVAQLRRGECSERKRHEAPCATCDVVDARIRAIERLVEVEALARFASWTFGRWKNGESLGDVGRAFDDLNHALFGHTRAIATRRDKLEAAVAAAREYRALVGGALVSGSFDPVSNVFRVQPNPIVETLDAALAALDNE